MDHTLNRNVKKLSLVVILIHERKNNVINQTKLERPKLNVNENFDDFYNEIVKALCKKT